MSNVLTLRKAGVKGGSAHKHKWTDNEREIVRREYDGTNRTAALIAAKLTYTCGDRITQCAVKGQVQMMGIAQDKSPRWTLEEEETLKEMITRYAPRTIAVKLGRSINAVVVKSKRLKCSRRARDGWYTKREVCDMCGVDHKKVQSWMDAGWLKAVPHTEVQPQKDGSACWHILEADVRRFLLYHSMELQGRNVDLFSIVNILVPEVTL